MNPTIRFILSFFPESMVLHLVSYLHKIKNTLAAAILRRDRAEAEAERLRAALIESKRAAVELQSEVDRSRSERDAATTSAAEANAKIVTLREGRAAAHVRAVAQSMRADEAEKRSEELARACLRAADYLSNEVTIARHDAAGDERALRFADEIRVIAAGTAEPRIDPDRLDVVSAVIISEAGYLLLAKRLPTAAFADLYETPGGKVNHGEPARVALAREIREELGVDCEVGAIFGATNADPPDVTRPLRITFFRVTLKGVPQALAAESLLWASREEVLSLPMLPGNSTLRAELAALCSPASTSVACVYCGNPSKDVYHLRLSAWADASLCGVCAGDPAITVDKIAARAAQVAHQNQDRAASLPMSGVEKKQ